MPSGIGKYRNKGRKQITPAPTTLWPPPWELNIDILPMKRETQSKRVIAECHQTRYKGLL